MKVLFLENDAITDAATVHLKGMNTLEELHLDETKLTDAGLANLQSLPRLTTLRVRKTRITPKGVAAFRAAAPACRIEYDERSDAAGK